MMTSVLPVSLMFLWFCSWCGTGLFLYASVKRCSCFMVCAGEATGLGQSRRSTGLEIGCLIDTASGLLTFTSSGMDLTTFYQVN